MSTSAGNRKTPPSGGPVTGVVATPFPGRTDSTSRTRGRRPPAPVGSPRRSEAVRAIHEGSRIGDRQGRRSRARGRSRPDPPPDPHHRLANPRSLDAEHRPDLAPRVPQPAERGRARDHIPRNQASGGHGAPKATDDMGSPAPNELKAARLAAKDVDLSATTPSFLDWDGPQPQLRLLRRVQVAAAYGSAFGHLVKGGSRPPLDDSLRKRGHLLQRLGLGPLPDHLLPEEVAALDVAVDAVPRAEERTHRLTSPRVAEELCSEPCPMTCAPGKPIRSAGPEAKRSGVLDATLAFRGAAFLVELPVRPTRLSDGAQVTPSPPFIMGEMSDLVGDCTRRSAIRTGRDLRRILQAEQASGLTVVSSGPRCRATKC